MKKINLIERLWTDSHEKQSPQRFVRYAAILIMLLTLGVGQMWADVHLYNGYIKASFNGSNCWSGSYYEMYSGGPNASTDKAADMGTLTGEFRIKAVKWKINTNYKGNHSMSYMWYNVDGGSSSTHSQHWDGTENDAYPESSSTNLLAASSTDASGVHYLNVGFYMDYYWGSGDNDKENRQELKTYYFKYKVLPPEVNGGDFTITSTDSQGGTGADSDHPMLITNGLSTTMFTVTASKAHTDANSVLCVSFDNGSNWSTGANASATTVTSGLKTVSSDVRSFVVKVKFRNSSDATLESATTVSKTFYYKEQPAGITVNAGSNGKVSIDNSNWSTSESIEDISLNTWYDIYAQGNTHYDFSSWSKGTNSSNITLEGSTAHTRIKIASGAVSSVTANFVEHPYTINIVNGTAASTTAKIATYGQATKSEPNGKYFTGWTVPGSNFTLTGGTKTSDATIKFFATANGTVTANMTPIWYLKGAFNDWGTTHPFVFTSATSGYVDVELSANSNFKVYDAQHSLMYGSQYGIENGTRLSTTLWSDNDNVCPINIQSIAGTYRFTLDISGTYPVITVTLPVVNQVRISSASPTDATNTGNFNLTDQGSNNWRVQRRLNANTTYTFKIVSATTWYGKNSTAITRDNASASSLSTSGANMTVRTDAAGNYTFNFNSSSKNLSVSYPTIYAITLKTKSFYNESATGTVDSNGGTVSAVDNYGATIANGGKVQTGGTVTFTATPKTGYTFEGWFSNADCAEGNKYVDNNTTINISGEGGTVLELSNITGNKTVYAKFSEIMTTVAIRYTKTDDISGARTGWVKVGGVTKEPNSTVKVGVHTTVTLRAEADSSSHYYGGWSYFSHDDYEKTDSVGADYHCNLTIRGKGAGDDYQSIYVSFPQLEKIYFKNWNEDTKTQLWDSVYVGFAPYHNTGYGANVKGKSDDDVRAMKRDSEDDYNYKKGKYDYYCMWWSYVPRWVTRTGTGDAKKVVFFNKAEMRGQNNFWKVDDGKGGKENGKAADRGDYNKKNNMFVPASTKKETVNSCDYYSNGYWRNFWVSANEKQGYYLQKKTGTNTYEELGEFLATKGTTYTNEFLTEMEYTVRFDNTNAADFRIVSAGGEHYVANANLTSGSPSSYLKSNNNNDASFRMTPTAEGNYVFKIIQGSDTMDISVDYPVAIGDYILKNTYNDGSVRTAQSDVIKASVADKETRYSMYLSTLGTETLVLRKCTAIVSNKPVWQDVELSSTSGSKLADILTTVGSTPGVYQFDLTINKSTDKVSDVDSIRLYSGNYYIKVDAAPGGWAGYTKNVMDKNSLGFDRTKSYTFDNYWCHYYSTGTGHNSNIKCVVANDYCNQLSDTLKQDSLHIAWMSGNEPYVPVDGTSIRFSYNSATNTINRSYLAAQDDDYYLDIKVYNSAKIYNESDVDLYTTSFDNTWANRCRFTDTKDWVYEKTIKVIPGGKAGVVAKYQGVQQNFLPDTTTLIGSPDASSTKYMIRLVYDFKTNYMMSSFMIDDETTINENLSDFDMLWVRYKDKSATQLTLGTGKKLTNVRPIGAIEFRYDSVNYYASHTGNWKDLSSWNNPGARQYLKYFVSFPFDVELNSIFGLNQAQYGRYWHYVIQKYDGAARAKDGLFFGDGDNYWVDLEPGDTLHANEGYCVIFDNDYVRGTWGQMWENKTSGAKVYLYFPAIKEVASITNDNTTSTVAPHTCTSDRSWTTDEGKTKYHSITDSHWSLIGNPLFHDAYIKEFTNENDSILRSYYEMDLTSTWALQDWKTKTVTKGTTKLKAMSSVLVQWYGTINWGTSAGALSAPKRRASEDKNYLAELQIWYNGNKADETFVRLEDGANEGFELREDMCKVLVKSRPNIYTFTGDYDVAYNEMPVADCTIPVGIVARKNGTYTISMPSNFSGTVTLIDTYTQTRTNLALDDYEVYLEKGTIDDRFELEINVNKMPTAIDGAGDGSGSLKDGKAHKFIMNDMMYILNDGVLYDATGKRVK